MDDDHAIATFMRRLAAAPTAEQPHLADLHVLWWKGKLLRRWDAEQKAMMPLDVLGPVQLAGAVAAVTLLVFWAVPSLLRTLIPG